MARRTNLLATAYDVRTLDALREGISIKSGSDGSVDAFFAKQVVNVDIIHACDDQSLLQIYRSQNTEDIWKKTQASH
jgi:hypothetical protein